MVKTELERIGKRVSTFQGLLLLVLKMSHFMLRKMRHITAHVMSVGQEPVSHKYLLGPLGLGTAPQQCPPARTPRNGGWSAAWNSLALDLLQVGQKASVSLDFSPALGGHCRVKVPQSHSLCGWSITGPAKPGKAPLAFPRESVGEDHGFPRMLFPWETGLVRVRLELLLHLA